MSAAIVEEIGGGPKTEEPPLPAAVPPPSSSSSLPSPLDNETPSVSSLFPTAMSGKRRSPFDTLDQGSSKPRKKRAFKKAPGAPKRAKSAYILFSQQQRAVIKEKLGPGAKVTEIMRGIADAWKELPDDQRAHWDAESEKDKGRYKNEIDNYTGPLKVANRRQKKPADAPKRAMSAFLLYSQVKRAELKQEHPSKKNVEISQLLGELWRDLPAQDKEPFQKQAKADGAKYKEFMTKYKEDGSSLGGGADDDEDDEEEEATAAYGMEEEEENGRQGAEEEDEEEEVPERGREDEEDEEEDEEQQVVDEEETDDDEQY